MGAGLELGALAGASLGSGPPWLARAVAMVAEGAAIASDATMSM